MRTSVRMILAVFALGILWQTASSGAQTLQPKIDPHLQTVLNAAQDEELIPVYIMLGERLSLEHLQSMTRGLNKQDRRKEAVRILKEYAATSQKNVRIYLEQSRTHGLVKDVKIIWAINVIAFKGYPGVIYNLAENYREIEKLFYDAEIPIEQLLDDNGIAAYNAKHGIILAPTFSPQPGLTLINAPQVWAEGDSGHGVIVANIDTGTDWKHPDLSHNIWNNLGEDANGNGRTMMPSGSTWIFDPGDVNGIDDDGNGKIDDFIGWDFDNNENNPDDGDTHGTATSGIVAGDGSNGTETGVAPRAKIMILKNSGGGETGYWQAQQYAIENGADIVTSSLSYKWYFSPQPNYPMFRQMNDMELAAGVLHTNSTSNDGNSTGIPFNISAPGNSPGPWIHPDQTLVGGISSVVGSANVVASTDVIASSSPWGPAAWEDFQLNHPSYPYPMPLAYQDYPYETLPGSIGLIKPDVAAPGNGTTSTAPGGGYQSFSGTSGATPHLAGVAALMLSINPDLEPEDLSRIMQTTAVEKGEPGKDNRYGAGRVDAYAAYLQALAEAGSPAAPAALTAYSDYTTPTSMLLEWENPTYLLNGDTLLPGDFSVVIIRNGEKTDSVSGLFNTYTDEGLNDGQEYTYEIYAKVDSSGRSSGSISASWIAGGSPIPNPATSFSVSGSLNQVTLYWHSPSENLDGTPMDDYAGVNVYRNGTLVTTFARTSADTGMTDSDSYTVDPPGYYDWHITVVDNENPANESEPTIALGTPLNIPISDEFTAMGAPNPGLWVNSGAEVNNRSDNPPSAPYALNLNGSPDGEDIVELKPLDLTGMESSGIFLSYYYQPQGSGNAPEPEDSLRIYFKNDLDEWVPVKSYPGSPKLPFAQETIEIASAPAGSGSYFHGQFQVRFRSTGGAGPFPNDDWFIDDIILDTPVGIEADAPVPLTFAVSRNYPNPFNPSTTIEYQLPQQREVELIVYNTLGQKVRTLLRQSAPAGYHKVIWDGRNDSGQPVASGIYLYRFSAGDYRMIRKMVLLR